MSDENELCSPLVRAILTGLAAEIRALNTDKEACIERMVDAGNEALRRMQLESEISVAESESLQLSIKSFYKSVTPDVGEIETRPVTRHT